jgi:hypothetical protein
MLSFQALQVRHDDNKNKLLYLDIHQATVTEVTMKAHAIPSFRRI